MLVLQVPHPVFLSEALRGLADLWKNPDLETAHAENEVRVVLGIDAHEAVLPLQGGHAARQAVLDVPMGGAAEVDVVLHESHARVPRPALLVVVPHDVLVVGVRVLGQVALDELAGIVLVEAQHHVDLVHVAAVETDRVPGLGLDVAEAEELVGHLRWTRELRGASEAEHEQVQHEAVVLHDEAGELQAADEAVAVGVAHVLVGDHHVVLRGHVVGDVVIHDQAQQPVEHGQVHLLVHLLELGLHEDHALPLGGVPHVREVVDPLAPLVHQQRRWLRVRGFDPVGEEVPLVRLIPEVLVQIGVGDLLQRLDLKHRDEVAVEVHELDGDFLESALREQMALDARQRLVGVVVGLLNQPELLSLLLVEPHRRGVTLLEPLEREDEQLGVVLVAQGREGDGRELARLEPVHGRRVDGHGLLGGHVGPILEVVVLPLLLSLEPQPREPTQVLAAHSLVDGGAAADALTVVVGHVGPPVRLGLYVSENHVLDGGWQPRDLPGNVGFPAAPRLREVLKDGARLVLLDALGHHVEDVVHHRRAQLEVEVRLHPLLGDGLGHALGVAPLELPRQQVPEPPLQQRHNAAEEEEPHPPHGSPEPHAWALADWARVETVVDQVLQVLAHADLAH
mmetsp:Transcript_62206/g.196852  ORF Transcript_62206/g.196852 Transcript_62206/m.196852 type:complete len:623 (-) Transcript_62206:2053-3921(-)